MIKTLAMYVGQCWGQETLMRHLRVSAKTKTSCPACEKNMHARPHTHRDACQL